MAPKEVTAHLCATDTNFSETYRMFFDHYWPYLNNIFLFLSYLTIIVGNVIITVHVRRSDESKDMGQGVKSAGGSQPGRTSSKSRQLSLMLIIDSASVIVLTLPFSIYTLLASSFQLFEDSPGGRGQKNLAFAVTFYLLYVNRSATFFLYCISGARFRDTLKDMLRRTALHREGSSTEFVST